MNLGNLHEQSDIKIKIICHLSPKPKTKNHLVEPGSCKVSDANRSKFEKKKKKWNGTVTSIGFAESFFGTPLSNQRCTSATTSGFLLSAKVYRIAGSRVGGLP